MHTKQASAELQPLAARILVTAHDLFYREGIRATGIDRLIAESGVAKKTFYRYYPTKNELVLRFLDYRHANWIEWFDDALQRYGGTPFSIVPALAEWFSSETYRGCAFINTVVELGNTFPEAVDIARRHKADMRVSIRKLMSPEPTFDPLALALAITVDGAIVQVQFGAPVERVLESLAVLVCSLENSVEPTSAAKKSRRLRAASGRGHT
jgi:AcrR family transcriptional regulator